MTPDLITRLRELNDPDATLDVASARFYLRQSANEIENLRSALKRVADFHVPLTLSEPVDDVSLEDQPIAVAGRARALFAIVKNIASEALK